MFWELWFTHCTGSVCRVSLPSRARPVKNTPKLAIARMGPVQMGSEPSHMVKAEMRLLR